MLVEETRPQQHMRALQQANTIRLNRLALRRRIRAGETTVAAVLRDIPPEARTMTIGTLLAAQHRWAERRVRSFLWRVAVPESKRLAALTPRQRDLLLAELA